MCTLIYIKIRQYRWNWQISGYAQSSFNTKLALTSSLSLVWIPWNTRPMALELELVVLTDQGTWALPGLGAGANRASLASEAISSGWGSSKLWQMRLISWKSIHYLARINYSFLLCGGANATTSATETLGLISGDSKLSRVFLCFCNVVSGCYQVIGQYTLRINLINNRTE
jgi:hypothetical protein